MKKIILIMAMLAFSALKADACVGKLLTIGVVNTPAGQVLAEMVSSLINERTGTNVTVKFFGNDHDLYAALNAKEIEIVIENTTSAMHELNKPADANADRSYEFVKAAYEREKGLVWLKPFGFQHDRQDAPPSHTAAVLRLDILNNFPALPRVIGKLGFTLNDDQYRKLVKSVESGEQPKKAARDFLKSRKLI